MNFVHEDPNFVNLLGIITENRNISPAVIEKDYWGNTTLEQDCANIRAWIRSLG